MKNDFLSQIVRVLRNKLQEPFRASSGINIIILIQVVLFAVNFLVDWLTVTGTYNLGYLQSHLAVSINHQQPFYKGSIFIHQFIHSSLPALLLNTVTLWVFGHLLKQQIGEREVVINYLLGSLLAGAVYVASHFVFQIFSGHTILEGSYGGSLTLIAACSVFFRNRLVRVYNFSVPFWKAGMLAFGLNFVLQYQNNIAFILITIACVYFGVRYAASQTQLFSRKEI